MDDVAQRRHVVFLRTSSGSFIRRMNMVGTMKMVSILSRSISRKNSSGVEPRHQHQRAAEAARRAGRTSSARSDRADPAGCARAPGFRP